MRRQRATPPRHTVFEGSDYRCAVVRNRRLAGTWMSPGRPLPGSSRQVVAGFRSRDPGGEPASMLNGRYGFYCPVELCQEPFYYDRRSHDPTLGTHQLQWLGLAGSVSAAGDRKPTGDSLPPVNRLPSLRPRRSRPSTRIPRRVPDAVRRRHGGEARRKAKSKPESAEVAESAEGSTLSGLHEQELPGSSRRTEGFCSIHDLAQAADCSCRQK